MSDARWDMEYNKVYDLKQEIIKICNEQGIKVPEFRRNSRSWELEPILNELKNETN